MAVVIAAKRVSPIASFLGLVGGGSKGLCRGGEVLLVSERRIGRHLSTASTEARQGWTWRGYENMTRTTMAAFPIVELTDGGSKYSVSIGAGVLRKGVGALTYT